MEKVSHLSEAREEVMRKIGRNVILYQEMELMLKHILSAYSISGYAGEIESNTKNRREQVRRKTFGFLTENYLVNTNKEYKTPIVNLSEDKKFYFDLNLNIECDPAYFARKRQSLKTIVKDRNKLVHELLMDFDLNSVEGCFKTETFLDAQYDKLIPEHNQLKRFIQRAEEGLKNLSEYVKSEQFKEDWKLSALRQNVVVVLLAEIAEQNSRPDGWTLLNIADEIVGKEAEKEMIAIKKKYHVQKLKELILATKIFDIYEESTEKGGKRMLYRLKDEWRLSPVDG